jgi:hypothetical protein
MRLASMDADNGEQKFRSCPRPSRPSALRGKGEHDDANRRANRAAYRPFLDMLDAAFNGVLPELFHDARDRHARHLFVRHLRLRGGPLHDGIDKGSLRDNDANPVAALG